METNNESIYVAHEFRHRYPDRTQESEPVEVPKNKEIMEQRKLEKKPIPLSKPSSMSSLILWNIAKALDLQPSLDLKLAIKRVKQRLDTDADGRDISTTSKDHPEEQHLLCALLAWQQLGHHDADSLYSFVELKKDEIAKSNHKNQKNIRESIKSTNTNGKLSTTLHTVFPKHSMDGSFGPHTTGPIVSLPVESVVMQVKSDAQNHARLSKQLEKDIKVKLEEAGALDASCAKAIETLDAATSELRDRASQLARREAKRVQLLERAEVAWVDLEAGYQKRFALADEKENDLKNQLKKMIVDLAEYKKICTTFLPEDLKKKDVLVKEALEELTQLEKQVSELVSTKQDLSAERAMGEASLAQELFKSTQYERDLKFEEEQTHRMLESLQHEHEAARALTCEAERAMRAELAGLRKQIQDVSKDLLKEDNDNLKIKEEQDKLRKEKAGLIEDLEGCKTMCDKNMQGQLDELKKKKEYLLVLQEKVLTCQCQMPMDAELQVQRTPSLAAMCYCEPEDNLQESCSCTSLRHRLLSSLLSDLFSGLQAELSRIGSEVPCQLLKCLEDSHNWDRRSDTKTNLRSFFSRLLKSELDIAIATSIENYHAKWVGNACADSVKMIPTLEDDLKEGWQERAIERRAKQMANQLAEELVSKRTEEIEKRTLEKIKAGPPPCVCKPPKPEDKGCNPDCCEKQTALFSCLIHPNSPFIPNTTTKTSNSAITQQADKTSPPAFWKQTIQEVTQLKLQIEDLKKDSVKKEDLRLMKDDISKLVRETSVLENEDLEVITRDYSKIYGETIKKDTKFLRAAKRDEFPKTRNKNKLGVPRTSATKDYKNSFKKVSINERPTKLSKQQVHDQSYAVNLCLCGPQKNVTTLQNAQINNSEKWKPKSVKDIMPQSSIVKQTKPINVSLPSLELTENRTVISEPCGSKCKCFRKMPSNTSIDELLQKLASFNLDFVSREACIKQVKSCLSKCSQTVIKEAVRILNQNDSKKKLSFLTESVLNTQVNASYLKQNEKKNVSMITESNNNQVNVNYIHEDTFMKNSRQNRSFSKQPANTESEYMGTVYLDKSHENICKCLINLAESNQETYDDNNNIPFQCINTKTCGCTMYQDMQKDNKRSQTEELTKKKVQSYQCQVTLSKDVPKLNEFSSSPINSNYLNSQKEIKLKADLNNVPQDTELFSSGGEYCIKFLGVTLDDLSPIKNKKIKTMSHNIGDLIIPKEKHGVSGRNLPKKSTYIKQFNSLPKHHVLPREKHYQTGFDDCKKDERKAKFEESTDFMNNFLQDKDFETKSLKETDNTPRVSFNGANVDSGELEVNVFHLLEDHIKQKFEDYKSFSCNICIPPEEEQKFYSTVLQRVKQVISDYVNKTKCDCSKTLPQNGSWDRAYGLLQEYLKIKIKRVQCLCVLNENKKDAILPEALEKVCNLIENDFQRLRDICTCNNRTETRTKIVRKGDLVVPTELPEKDTNISQGKYNDVEVQHFSTVTKYSKQNSNNSMILKENMSSQANPTFRMVAKSCDVIGPYSNRNIKTTETDHIITDSKSNGVMYNTCDCCYNTDKVDIRKFPEMFGTKEVFVNLYAEKSINTSKNCESPKFGIDKAPPRCLSADKVESTETISTIEVSDHDENIQDAQNRAVAKQTPRAPYIGFKADCTCDSALVIQAENDKIDTVWKEFNVSNNNNPNFPNIMHGTQNISRDNIVNCHSVPDDVKSHSVPDDVPMDKASKTAIPSVDILTRETGTIAQNEEDIVLKYSLNSVNFSNHVENTHDECLSLDTAATCSSSDVYPVDWLQVPVPINSGQSDAVKLTQSIYFPGLQRDNEKNSLISEPGTNPVLKKMSENCGCQKVPICHVKMLVEHIEKNLVEFKCTCDSLISKVCPVHSKRP